MSDEGQGFSRIIFAAIMQTLLRLVVSIVFYLISGLIGLVISWIYGVTLGKRSQLTAYPRFTYLAGAIATMLHAAVLIGGYIGLELQPQPPWW